MEKQLNKKNHQQNKYFELDEYLKKINLDPNEGEHLLIISSTRNCGKSTNVTNYIIDYWKKFNYERCVAFVRTNDLIMTKWKQSFKNFFDEENIIILGNFIYKIEYKENEKDKEKKKEILSKKEIGCFIDVMNEANYRSMAGGGFKNYHFVFYEEFNEGVPLPKYYEHFVNLLSTIKRQNSPFFVLLLGNKINANNDIFINYNLNVNRRDLNIDWIQKVDEYITYIDIGFNTFKSLNPKNSFVNNIAKYNENTNNLFNNGGFLEGTKYNVLNSKEFLNRKTLYNFALFENVYEYGECEIDNENVYYILKNNNINNNVIALEKVAYSKNKNFEKIDQQDIEDVADFIYQLNKEGKIFYDSFDTLLYFEKFIFKYSVIFDLD